MIESSKIIICFFSNAQKEGTERKIEEGFKFAGKLFESLGEEIELFRSDKQCVPGMKAAERFAMQSAARRNTTAARWVRFIQALWVLTKIRAPRNVSAEQTTLAVDSERSGIDAGWVLSCLGVI